jgi:hypothetical protein
MGKPTFARSRKRNALSFSNTLQFLVLPSLKIISVAVVSFAAKCYFGQLPQSPDLGAVIVVFVASENCVNATYCEIAPLEQGGNGLSRKSRMDQNV